MKTCFQTHAGLMSRIKTETLASLPEETRSSLGINPSSAVTGESVQQSIEEVQALVHKAMSIL